MAERMFTAHQVSEQSIVVFCDNKLSAPAPKKQGIEISSVDSLQELRAAIRLLDTGAWRGTTLVGGYAESSVTKECQEVLSEISNRLDTATLGDIFNIRIGLVTGANRFFVVNQSTACVSELPETILVPVIAGSEELVGLSVTREDLVRTRNANERCLLVDTSREKQISRRTNKYLASFPTEERLCNATFAKRQPWHRTNDNLIPDAFMSYMTHNGPKIALNRAKTTSTNAVHRAFRKPHIDNATTKLAAISLAGTYSQLSAELRGRTYGDGVLKLEPSELRRIDVICPLRTSETNINKAYKALDTLYRARRYADAQHFADYFLLSSLSRDARGRYIRVLSNALAALRKLRAPGRKL
jgi:hypothetical protein